jgi:alpha-methylacyl-CoA racemase
MTAPLTGIRVVDLTRLVAGDYCTSLLGGLGADVVKVEDPSRGDYIGEFGGVVDDVPVAHHLFNRGKRSVCIDLKTTEGQGLLRKFVAKADLVVESFRPGVMRRLGVDHEQALSDHPALVWVAISGYGSHDPRSRSPGHDLNYLAEAGLLDRLTGRDGRPVSPPIPIADLVGGGLLPAFTAVALVLQARLTGRGGYVDASIAGGVALLPSVLLADVTAGVSVAADGHETFLGGALACYDVYRLKDGYAVVGALEEKFWEPLCEILGHPELIPLQWNPQAQSEVRAVLEVSFGELTRADISTLGLDNRACVSVVRSYEDLVSARDAIEQGTVTTTASGVHVPGMPFRIDGRRLPPPSSAPRRGEHTLDVLAEVGVDGRSAAALLAAGVVSQTKARTQTGF